LEERDKWSDDSISHLIDADDEPSGTIHLVSCAREIGKGVVPMEEDIDVFSGEIGREKERVTVDEWGMDLVSYRTLEAAQLHKRMLERRAWGASSILSHASSVSSSSHDRKPPGTSKSQTRPPLNEDARKHVEEWMKLEMSMSPKESNSIVQRKKPETPTFPVDHGEVKREDWISAQLQKGMCSHLHVQRKFSH
jgi:hypothetical protein